MTTEDTTKLVLRAVARVYEGRHSLLCQEALGSLYVRVREVLVDTTTPARLPELAHELALAVFLELATTAAEANLPPDLLPLLHQEIAVALGSNPLTHSSEETA